MKQFGPRISSIFHLSHIGQKTVYSYIVHRLGKVRGRRHMFSCNRSDLMHEINGVIPRLLNQVCDIPMLCDVVSKSEIVRIEHVQTVLKDGAIFGPTMKADPDPTSDDEPTVDK